MLRTCQVRENGVYIQEFTDQETVNNANLYQITRPGTIIIHFHPTYWQHHPRFATLIISFYRLLLNLSYLFSAPTGISTQKLNQLAQ